MFVAQLTIGQWNRIILNMGLSAIELAGLLIAVLIGVNLIAGEIDRRTIYATLARPISRASFVVGRFLGLLLILAVDVGLMGSVLALILKMAGYPSGLPMLEALGLILVELSLLAASAVFFGSFSTPVLASAYSLSLFLIGHLLADLKAFGHKTPSLLGKRFAQAAYWLLPDLELLNVKARVANELPIDHHAVLLGASFGVAYAAALLALAIVVFGRRDLK
jgi:ABC-type transport system involved in multi-copper enzyme maturation permease subunit